MHYVAQRIADTNFGVFGIDNKTKWEEARNLTETKAIGLAYQKNSTLRALTEAVGNSNFYTCEDKPK